MRQPLLMYTFWITQSVLQRVASQHKVFFFLFFLPLPFSLSKCWQNLKSSCLISRKCHGNNLIVYRKTQNPVWINCSTLKKIIHSARVQVWHDGNKWIVDNVSTVTRTVSKILYYTNEGVQGNNNKWPRWFSEWNQKLCNLNSYTAKYTVVYCKNCVYVLEVQHTPICCVILLDFLHFEPICCVRLLHMLYKYTTISYAV